MVYSDVEGGAAGTGNFDLDPQFVEAPGRDFHLRTASPCIDTGNPALTDLDGSRADVGGFWMQTLNVRSNTRLADWTAPTWPEISSVVGGRCVLRTNVGVAFGGATYSIAGTVSGKAPGVAFGGFQIPINPDFYTEFTLSSPNTAPLANSLGNLDVDGHADTVLSLGPRLAGFPVGLTSHHVTMVLGNGVPLAAVTNAAVCTILPR